MIPPRVFAHATRARSTSFRRTPRNLQQPGRVARPRLLGVPRNDGYGALRVCATLRAAPRQRKIRRDSSMLRRKRGFVLARCAFGARRAQRLRYYRGSSAPAGGGSLAIEEFALRCTEV